ncbi:MAG: helix-turn-helix transcriptional regulator [Porticoccaceae bacterium]|nr:helix-turn-helix transcriptional regulator [Porticoccaceae bacterium]|tara:strand:- start:201 stop:533 length:333 start_codon:yes stop_codon:yes gene_type:complete
MATRLDISKQLAKLMRDQGISQSALSRATGVPQPTINRILSEVTREPRRDSVVRIANYFGITPESLYEAPYKQSAAQQKKQSIEALFDLISELDEADRNTLFDRVAKEIN